MKRRRQWGMLSGMLGERVKPKACAHFCDIIVNVTERAFNGHVGVFFLAVAPLGENVLAWGCDLLIERTHIG